MFFAISKRLRQFALGAIVLVGGALLAPVHALERSDILLDIVSNCVDPARANYCAKCRVPRSDAVCGDVLDCKKSTDVWALTDQYTVIRDIKMCGCPSEFVHGLALPTYPVRGVEDPKRPEGIWQFAWDAAIHRIEPESLALVVNPRLYRSQNQLHVHILRLVPDMRGHLEMESPSYVSSLDSIWATAARLAATKGLEDYGVLVSQRPGGDFMVVVTAFSPENAFTQWHCD
jgi:CDP-diacylglycerol pyrophosphatase